MIIPAKDETEAQFKWGQIHSQQCKAFQDHLALVTKELNDEIAEKFLSIKQESEKTWFCSCKVCLGEMIVPGNDQTEALLTWGQIHAKQCPAMREFVADELKKMNIKAVEKFLLIRRES